jgi:hypothetical protein
METPIEPADYIRGVKVVQIEDLRVARGKTRRPRSTCRHLSVTYDQDERRIWCADCESEVDPFDGFLNIVEYFDAAFNNLKRRLEKVQEAEQFSVRSRAAKTMDKYWRSTKKAPCCPHCRMALLPEDVVGKRLPVIGKEFELARRKASAPKETT